ncbi:MAG: peroxiredoxin [Oleiphilaceae bacterium]|jgi:peroxiredoxin
MQKLKSLFISTWITLLFVGCGRAIYKLLETNTSNVWYWVLLALAPSAVFFIWLFLASVARTQIATKLLITFSGIASIGLLTQQSHQTEPLFWALIIGLLGSGLYEWWYSSFGKRESAILSLGATLPSLQFMQSDGQPFATEALNKPMLLIFFRGNWCPLCMAQIKEVAIQYQKLADKGVEVMLISPQDQKQSASLSKRFSAPMTFLVDVNNKMAIKLRIQAEDGLPTGLQALGYDSDTVMPTVIMTDQTGKILFADLTDNYRVRPEPDVFLMVFSEAGI